MTTDRTATPPAVGSPALSEELGPAAALVERLQDEADQCRNDGATDIAALLDEAARELDSLIGTVGGLRGALKIQAEMAHSLARTVMADQISSDMRPDAGLAERAADMLTAYAELIRRDGASHVEEHHYLPEVEHTARELRRYVFGA